MKTTTEYLPNRPLRRIFLAVLLLGCVTTLRAATPDIDNSVELSGGKPTRISAHTLVDIPAALTLDIPHKKYPAPYPLSLPNFERESTVTHFFDPATIELLTVIQFQDSTLQAYLRGAVRMSDADSLNRVWDESIVPIYVVNSSDGGKSWSRPRLAIKHNSKTFVRLWILGRHKYELLALLITPQGEVMYAQSLDNGLTWSYPQSELIEKTSNDIIE